MEKVEKNTIELQKFIAQLKNKTLLPSGDTQFYGKVIFNWSGEPKEDLVRINILTGHHEGKVLVIDENKTFANLFVRFIPNSQDYEYEKGVLKISDTSGKSKIGNYEVSIQEK
jgi:hypothetical protein